MTEDEINQREEAWFRYCLKTDLDVETESYEEEYDAFCTGWNALRELTNNGPLPITPVEERIRQKDARYAQLEARVVELTPPF